MGVRVTVSFRNDNPNTIWNRLAARLGREPTDAEARAEVLRVLDEVLVERADAGRLPWQRRKVA